MFVIRDLNFTFLGCKLIFSICRETMASEWSRPSDYYGDDKLLMDKHRIRSWSLSKLDESIQCFVL